MTEETKDLVMTFLTRNCKKSIHSEHLFLEKQVFHLQGYYQKSVGMLKSLHDLPSKTSRISIFKSSFASSVHYESSYVQKLKVYPISGSLHGHGFQHNKIM